MKKNVAYSCKYTPVELLRAFEFTSKKLDTEAVDFGRADASLHANVCCHAKAVLQLTEDERSVVLTDCCDSMRRVYDVLAAQKRQDFLHFMELPHDDNNCAKGRLAGELARLVTALEKSTGKVFSSEAFFAAFDADAAAGVGEGFASSLSDLPTSPYFAIMGARATPSLLAAAKETLCAPVIDLTCASFRNIEAPPESLRGASRKQLMAWYAGALLEMLPCMRMADITGRRALTELPHMAGIIYNTVKFCDYYGFDYEEVSSAAKVPILKVESDYTKTPSGQLRTRLEALRETAGVGASAAAKAVAVASAAANSPASSSPSYFVGIDSGSTTTNMVALNERGEICASTIVRTGAKAERGAEAALNDICEQLGATMKNFAAIVATGYGRSSIDFATSTITEITCHAKGAHLIAPDVRTIIDIGGQDSKVICLDDAGNVSNFVMNDKCAAGTGRFLEAMARTLEMDLSEFAKSGLNYKRDITISSMCTVFAESEVISLIADNVAEPDIIHGLNKAIASRTAAMVARAKGTGLYIMTGGVARNRGVVAALEDALASRTHILVPENPDLCGALGAALIALEHDI